MVRQRWQMGLFTQSRHSPDACPMFPSKHSSTIFLLKILWWIRQSASITICCLSNPSCLWAPTKTPQISVWQLLIKLIWRNHHFLLNVTIKISCKGVIFLKIFSHYNTLVSLDTHQVWIIITIATHGQNASQPP